MVIKKTADTGEYSKNKKQYESTRIKLPKRKSWPKTDGWVTKSDLPATLILADDEPFVTKYEHYDPRKKRTFGCYAKWKDIDGKWKLDSSECPYCSRGDRAKARIYIIVSIEGGEEDERYLFGITVTAYSRILELYPDVTDWNGVTLLATTMEINIAGRQATTVTFDKPGNVSKDEEAPKKSKKKEEKASESEAEENEDIDQDVLKELVEKYKGLPALGLGKDDIRTMISNALTKDNIDSAYVEKIMEEIY